MTHPFRRLPVWRMLALAATTALILVAGASAASASKAPSQGTVTFAEQPGTPPDYIDPMMGVDYFSNANISDFEQVMYLPLYWFGDNGKPVLNQKLSIAMPPIFSNNNTVVTVTLKHWVWSNGQPITARDVIFWMNLLSAVTDPNAPAIGSSAAPGPSWAASVPGQFPVNVASYTQTGTYTVVFHLNSSYDPTWYLYNELSQITPMPQSAWDELSGSGPVGSYDTSAAARSVLTGASAPAGCTSSSPCYAPDNPGSATTGALGVAQFLNSESQDLTTYASNPLWQVVDGPFKMSQFTVSGFVKMVPNADYSGSPKPTIHAFEELPYTTDAAEFNALRSGAVSIGYLPPVDISQKKAVEALGYSYNTWPALGVDFIYINFTNQTVGPLFKQLYFRQAMQSLVDQSAYIKDFLHGTGSINNGPIPTVPANPYVSSLESKGEVYPYKPAEAVTLLKAHGWTVVPRGTSYCSKPGSGPGDCGAGIKAHQDASFNLSYLSGSTEVTSEMEAMQSAMKEGAGIDLTLSQGTYGVIEGKFYNCTYATPCNDWALAGNSTTNTWIYFPDYLPTGEELFSTGALANPGYYSSSVADSDIRATNVAPTYGDEITALHTYENYIARQLPVLEIPNSAFQLTMYKRDLKGLVPQGAYAEIYPQDYRISG
jgi:peptide/nickel transport system substrate-binding protein